MYVPGVFVCIEFNDDRDAAQRYLADTHTLLVGFEYLSFSGAIPAHTVTD